MRHPRLEAVFGARLDQLAFDHIKAIVGNEAAAEDTDLDYKKIIHANDAKTIAEFCKDLAAMANGRGGVLVVGVEEDSRSVPSVITGVDIRDAEIRRLRLTTAGRIFPHLDFEIRALPDAPGSDTGVLLVTVPRSSLAPHTYADADNRKKGEMVFPIRNGATTRWMAEPEVASTYQARFRAAADFAVRLDRVEEEAVTAFYEADVQATGKSTIARQLITVALVPDQPGRIRIDRPSLEEVREDLVGGDESLFADVGVASRRFIASDRLIRTPQQLQDTYVELHGDGAGCFVTTVTGGAPGEVELERFVVDVIQAVALLAGHARDRAGASGIATVRVCLLGAADCLERNPRFQVVLPDLDSTPLKIVRSWKGMAQATPLGQANPISAVGEANSLLDELADGGQNLAVTSALAVGECLQAFGLPELEQVTLEGTLKLDAWKSSGPPALDKLASLYGIPVE
jgi:hypothetical protein